MPRLAPAYCWPQVLLLVVLIILGMAGLRGAVTELRWNGPLWQDRVIIGVALEVISGILLVITLRRRAAASRVRHAVPPRGPDNATAARLRSALILVLGLGMIGLLVVIDDTLHLHVHIPAEPSPPGLLPNRHHQKPAKPEAAFHFPLTATLYGLLIVMLVAAVLFSIWWYRRVQIAASNRDDDFIAEDSADSENLREAVESGRSVLRTVENARAAIIACYVAMEDSLAERGATRAVADTPDELLARATSSGIVRGAAAERLTELFYKARFSSHPLDGGERDAAERALDELAVTLAEAGKPKASGRSL